MQSQPKKGEEKGLPQGEGKRVEGKDRRVRGRRPGGSTATAVVAKVRGTGEKMRKALGSGVLKTLLCDKTQHHGYGHMQGAPIVFKALALGLRTGPKQANTRRKGEKKVEKRMR